MTRQEAVDKWNNGERVFLKKNETLFIVSGQYLTIIEKEGTEKIGPLPSRLLITCIEDKLKMLLTEVEFTLALL